MWWIVTAVFPCIWDGSSPKRWNLDQSFYPPNPAGHLAGLWNAYVGIFLKHEWLKFKGQEWRGDPRGSEPPPHYLESLSERCMPPPLEKQRQMHFGSIIRTKKTCLLTTDVWYFSCCFSIWFGFWCSNLGFLVPSVSTTPGYAYVDIHSNDCFQNDLDIL